MWPLTAVGLLLWYLLVRRAAHLRLEPAPADASGRRIWAARQRARLQRHQALIVALVAAAPLLGLLGTVGGMIDTFDALTAVGDPRQGISGGISAALTTTQMGLAVAIPGLVMERLLHLKAARLDHELTRLAEGAP
ncbi:MAG: MotA/TolQ/ExbB proton channel family protein [Myxococcales bacterium]|nr:MotA/TolQ/ExbB proton channel family protein [Myxococcales bacterium]